MRQANELINHRRFFDWLRNYHKSEKLLRLGQAFLNEFFPAEPNPDLLNEYNEGAAIFTIMNVYVKFEGA